MWANYSDQFPPLLYIDTTGLPKEIRASAAFGCPISPSIRSGGMTLETCFRRLASNQNGSDSARCPTFTGVIRFRISDSVYLTWLKIGTEHPKKGYRFGYNMILAKQKLPEIGGGILIL